jgi:glycosyltransferase involved in cell wall biosynthesis
MAMGKPVIATNWGGPADYLDSSCGILVEPKNYDAMVRDFSEAMKLLAGSPEIAHSMGQAGRDRVSREFYWHKKIEQMIEIYAELTNTAPAQALRRDSEMRKASV